MVQKRVISFLLAFVLAALPLTASATNEFRSAEHHQTKRVPIQNTEAHVSDSCKQFSDVADNYWGKDGISYVVDKGLFNGTGYGMFSPEMPMNRAMICTVLHRFAGSPAVSGTSGYSDVKSGQWYTAGVTWAKQNEILPLDLLNSSKLELERGLTRGDFAVMMRNYYEVSGGDLFNDAIIGVGLTYRDIPVKNLVVEYAIAWLYTYSILNGTSNTTMSPEMVLTRSQMATILERYDRQFGAIIPNKPQETVVVAPPAYHKQANPAVFNSVLTEEAYDTLRECIVNGGDSTPVAMSEETRTAMLNAVAAISQYPIYDLKSGKVTRGIVETSYFSTKYSSSYANSAAICQQFLSTLDGKSESEKLYAIACYVCARLDYDANSTSTPKTLFADSSVKKGNCMSFAHGFHFLCQLADIPCVLVISDIHQWNEVYTGGRWYCVDLTSFDHWYNANDTGILLHDASDLIDSGYKQNDPNLTLFAKELLVPSSTK